MKRNKFINSLTASNKDIRADRARIIGEDVKDASEELVRVLTQESRNLERKLLNLSDMHRDSELSLKVVKDNFDAKTWVKNIQDTKVELAMKKVELKIAEDTHEEWFEEIEEKETKKSSRRSTKGDVVEDKNEQ